MSPLWHRTLAEACTQLARLEQDLDAIARRDEEAALMRWERDQQAEWASIQASKRSDTAFYPLNCWAM